MWNKVVLVAAVILLGFVYSVLLIGIILAFSWALTNFPNPLFAAILGIVAVSFVIVAINGIMHFNRIRKDA